MNNQKLIPTIMITMSEMMVSVVVAKDLNPWELIIGIDLKR